MSGIDRMQKLVVAVQLMQCDMKTLQVNLLEMFSIRKRLKTIPQLFRNGWTKIQQRLRGIERRLRMFCEIYKKL